MMSQISPQALRQATLNDVPEIVRVTNLAYQVERFCLRGDRTTEAEVKELMAAGTFLVLEGGPGRILGSAFIQLAGIRGYLGLLSVDPEAQGGGCSSLLMAAAERRCREAGCRFLDLTVVNLRLELFAFYARQGFAPYGTLPFPHPAKAIQPCHLIQFTKPLVPVEQL